MIGTSAGSMTMAMLVGGIGFAELASQWDDFASSGPRWRIPLIEFTRTAFGGIDPNQISTPIASIAVRLPRYRRVVMRPAEFSIPDLVAASCSIPPVIRTHLIDGVRYADGGLVSGVSADLAPESDLLVCVTPIARSVAGPVGRVSEWQARREFAKWTAKFRGDVLHVAPPPPIASLFSARLRDVADIEIGRQAYSPSVEYGREVAAQLRSAYSL